jgi:hypothetical protein
MPINICKISLKVYIIHFNISNDSLRIIINDKKLIEKCLIYLISKKVKFIIIYYRTKSIVKHLIIIKSIII